MFIRSCYSQAKRIASLKESRLCHDFEVLGVRVNTDKMADDASKAWASTKEVATTVGNWSVDQVAKMPERVQRLWKFVSMNPTIEDEQKANMLSSLQAFLSNAPSAVTNLITDAIDTIGVQNLNLDDFAALTDHRNWINAFASDEVWQGQPMDDFNTKNDRVHRTPLWLLKTLPLEKRQTIFEEYAHGFIPANVRAKFDKVFGEPKAKTKDRHDALVQNRDKISKAMTAMLGGDMPKPEQDPGNAIQDIAFESLQERYNAKGNFKSPILARDAQTAALTPSLPSFFAGAMKHGVLPPDAIQALQTTLKNDENNENLSATVLHDKLLKLDTTIKINEATNILGKMETWEKAALLLIAAYALVKHTKLAIGGVLTYLGIKYIGGVKDPLGSGIGKVKEGWDYLAGKTSKAGEKLLFNHEKNPATVAKTMVRFARGEDLHNVEEEAYVLSVLNAKSMTELSNAFIRDEKGWSLNLELLFGGRKNIPPHFKDKDYCRSMTNAIGYLLFSHYRSMNPGDADVKMVTDRMASLDFTQSWEGALRKDVNLGKTYDSLLVKGKMSAAGDGRQLHKFVGDQIGSLEKANVPQKEFETKRRSVLSFAGPHGKIPPTITNEGSYVALQVAGNDAIAHIPLRQFMSADPKMIMDKTIVWMGDKTRQTKSRNPLE